MPCCSVAIVAIACILTAVFAIMTAIAFSLQHRVYGRRFEKDGNLKYFGTQDFALRAVPV